MKKFIKKYGFKLLLIFFSMLTFSWSNIAFSQDKSPYIRIGKIVIDANQLESYKAALKEHAEVAVNKEPGVLSLYSVYDKNKPTHVTVFEIYASEDAYQSHIKTSHFLKYKTIVKDMVKSLELKDVIPIALETKPDSTREDKHQPDPQ
ncbi:MAG TPA: putative quinol monooxygenase [Chitinophagaceae bacterium]|nr:putative quinol monooxygenase [Chitinophagaceae bacterium]